jgi:hypothetical protein
VAAALPLLIRTQKALTCRTGIGQRRDESIEQGGHSS